MGPSLLSLHPWASKKFLTVVPSLLTLPQDDVVEPPGGCTHRGLCRAQLFCSKQTSLGLSSHTLVKAVVTSTYFITYVTIYRNCAPSEDRETSFTRVVGVGKSQNFKPISSEKGPLILRIEVKIKMPLSRNKNKTCCNFLLKF